MCYRDSLLGNPCKLPKREDGGVSEFVKPLGDSFINSLIVRCKDLSTLVKLDRILLLDGGPKVSLKYVGGLYMLLIFESKFELLAFKDHNSNVSSWFSWVDVWNGQTLPFERVAWLKITGVQLHLLDNKVFDSVGRLFGKVVHASRISKKDKDLSFDLVGVLVGEGDKICQPITLKWKGRRFRVWVNEELDDWISDSINEVSDWVDKIDEVDDSETDNTDEVLTTPVTGIPSVTPVDSRVAEKSHCQNMEGEKSGADIEKTAGFDYFCMGEDVIMKAADQVPRDVEVGPNILEAEVFNQIWILVGSSFLIIIFLIIIIKFRVVELIKGRGPIKLKFRRRTKPKVMWTKIF
ncbi:hypothetical protein HanHA300_Chr03g0078671 [Helianthus annuus]|nr:hypothetical protein HanHA300_Chr03g0078671 [Helianthus annuus]KAJ0766937.1 hypothetical protein HanLR1_Chr03g0083341 [Helianthus annuus]KAJ0772793.1 hypothetical protein HanOQP8_Chr03g0091471 [Helianthus annuus]KAJ0942325.1 hypothetical protein HanPSC8_Chr03g0090641 [Helianthus annuus]